MELENAVPLFGNANKGPIFGVELPISLPLPGGMRQSVPRNAELQRVRELVGDRTVGALEVALAIIEAFNRAGLTVERCVRCKQLVGCVPNCVPYCLKCYCLTQAEIEKPSGGV